MHVVRDSVVGQLSFRRDRAKQLHRLARIGSFLLSIPFYRHGQRWEKTRRTKFVSAPGTAVVAGQQILFRLSPKRANICQRYDRLVRLHVLFRTAVSTDNVLTLFFKPFDRSLLLKTTAVSRAKNLRGRWIFFSVAIKVLFCWLSYWNLNLSTHPKSVRLGR